MNDDNERLLWFARRIVQLEASLAEAKEREARADARRRDEHALADALADQLRQAARAGLINGVTLPPEGPERDQAMREGRSTLPLEQWRRRRRDAYPAYHTVPVDPFEKEPWP